VRYPRGEGVGVALPEIGVPLQIGKARTLREGTKVALLSYGGRLHECLKAADELAGLGLSTTVVDARFAKPLDTDLVSRLVREHEVLVTVEEGAIGGFGSHVLHYLTAANQLRDRARLRTMFLPDRFIGHAAPAEQYHDAGLDAGHIVAEVFKALDQEAKLTGLKAKA
jgi:1-deoxy-D-xylulose-5-phosphate synthase